MKKVFLLLLLPTLLMVMGCTPAMKVTGSWMNKEVVGTGKFQKIFLFTISANMSARQAFDNALASAAQAEGIAVVKSIDVFTPDYLDGRPTKENLIAKINATGCDAVFTSALMDMQSETRYVPGTTHYSPYPSYGYYGSFGGYYGYVDPYIYEPGYYVEDKTYYIESNLYDMESGDIVWSVQSEAFNPGDLEKSGRNYASLLFDQLQKEGVLNKK